MMRHVVFTLLVATPLALLLLSPPHSANAETATTPSAVMSAIYKAAIKQDAPDWLAPDERPKYLSKSLLALWAKADAKKPPDGDVGPIDFDLTADTNGLTLASFVTRLQSQTDKTAVVAVELGYQKPYVRRGRAIVIYDFIREDSRWRIDNIRTKTWSVRDLLSRWLKED